MCFFPSLLGPKHFVDDLEWHAVGLLIPENIDVIVTPKRPLAEKQTAWESIGNVS